MPTYDLIFGNKDYVLIFAAVVLIWLSSEVVGGRIIPSLRRGGSKIEQRKKRLNNVAGAGWIAVILASTLIPQFDISILPDWAYFLGIVMMLAGVALRQWAVAVLGRYFSNVIGVQAGQKVVQTGPYRLIRHPSYTGILMIQIGIALAFQTWAAVLVAGLSFGLTYGHRMLSEEKFLTRELGDSYVEYMKRTKRLVPFLI